MFLAQVSGLHAPVRTHHGGFVAGDHLAVDHHRQVVGQGEEGVDVVFDQHHGVAEAERMVELLLRLKKDHAMMLVEHDMDAIFALADHLTVMVNGLVIASDKPETVRADRNVQAAYLGEEH